MTPDQHAELRRIERALAVLERSPQGWVRVRGEA